MFRRHQFNSVFGTVVKIETDKYQVENIIGLSLHN
jgi:hypothetical protein